MRCPRGFTLVELMIVIAIIAIVVGIALPNLVAAREAADQTVVIATLRNLVAAQAQFQIGAKADEDGDGSGEYGGFREMTGAAAGRMPGALTPAVLSGAFGNLTANAEVARSGYLFKVYLPGPGGVGTPEDPLLGFTLGGGQDPDYAESAWCCYAWPINYTGTHGRTFAVNQRGDLIACEVAAYSGTGAGPAPDAAFSAPGSITGQFDIGGPGQNAGGEVWRQVN